MRGQLEQDWTGEGRWAVSLFVLLAYGWTWLWWVPAWVLLDTPQAWKLPMTLAGGFGPALAGVLLVRRLAAGAEDRPLNVWGFLAGAGLAMAAVTLFRLDPYGFAGEHLQIPADSPAATLWLDGLVVGISGFVIASAVSRRPGVRAFFRGIIPDRRAWALLVPVLVFLPMLLIFSNTLATWLGLDFPTPRYRREALSVWLPAMLIKLFTVAMLTGGNEEHGWRGVMLPLLQRRSNPFLSTLLIVVAWELWHLPVVVGGLYGEGPALSILAGRFVVMPLFAFLLTALYNHSRGSIFLCVVFHGCINSQIAVFGGAAMVAMPVAYVVVATLVVVMRMWRRERGFSPATPAARLPTEEPGAAPAVP